MKPLKHQHYQHNRHITRLLSLILVAIMLLQPAATAYGAEPDINTDPAVMAAEDITPAHDDMTATDTETPATESDNNLPEADIPDTDIPELTIPDDPAPVEDTEPVPAEDPIQKETVSEETAPTETVSEADIPEETVPEVVSSDALEAAGESYEEMKKREALTETEYQNWCRMIIAQMDSSWPDETKLMYMHDAVCRKVRYDYSWYGREMTYEPGYYYFICMGYSLLFEQLTTMSGFETVTIGSEANRPGIESHAWNRTILNGKAYYTDCTWDDADDDDPNLPPYYTHFLNSRTECARLHSDYDPSDWEIGAGSQLIKDSEWTAVDDKYDNAFWNYDVNNPPTILKNGKIMYNGQKGIQIHDFTKNLPIDGSQDPVLYGGESGWMLTNSCTVGNYRFFSEQKNTNNYRIIDGATKWLALSRIRRTGTDGTTITLKETTNPEAALLKVEGIEDNLLKYSMADQLTWEDRKTYGTIDISSAIPVTVPTQSITTECSNDISLDMGVKDTEQLSCTVLPTNASNTNIIWKTSDISIADVSLDGKVTATGSGNAIITAETVDGLSVQFNVSVKDRRYIKTITTPYTDTINLHVDDWFNSISPKDPETLQLTWSYAPTDALKKDVAFASYDTRVAYVDGNGLITARGVGETDIVIYQTDANGFNTAETTVHVKVWLYGEGPAKPDPSPNPNPDPNPNPSPDPNNPDPDKPKPNQAAYAVVGQKIDARRAFFEGETGIAMYKVTTPEGGSAAKYASITKTGILTCKKAGDIVITAYEKTGKNSYEAIAEADLEILKKPKLKLPAQMTYEGQEISARSCLTEGWDSNGITIAGWKSSKPSVIEIDENGNLKANHSGTATITAMIRKPGMNHTKNSVNVTAKVSVKIPSFAKANIAMLTGQKLVIGMKNVNGKSNAQWSVSGDLCEITAHTDKKGNPTGKAVLKAVKAGSDGSITCVVDEKTYTCHLTVGEPVMKKTYYKVKAGKKVTVGLKQTKLKAKDVEWKSEDENIAVVSKGGTVTGVNAGTVKVYTDAGGVRNECTVEVY